MTRSIAAFATASLALLAACTTTQSGPAERLEGTAWRAASIENTPAAESTPSTLRFFDRQLAGGSLGCNAYSTTYFADASGLRFGALAPTQKTCAVPVMEQESRFTSALAETRGLRLDPQGALLLLDAEGRTRARLVPMTP
ncbi:MAG TPA: META domain-containing protein [Burkholderiaceae bacterium]|nr:META domain-containing protein [Burkholderiaceae bacterium]